MIGRTIKNNGRFEFCELDEPETFTIVNSLIDFNVTRFYKIVNDLQKRNKTATVRLTDRQLVDVALAVFSKSGVSSYPVLQSALSLKVNNEKEFRRACQESAYELQKPDPLNGEGDDDV